MNKLQLKTSTVLQGDFTIQDLNLLIVFQVNCPGCFLYALPLASHLFSKYTPQGLNVLGLSTAFEDFEFNTKSNTELLLKESKLVGETQRVFKKNSLDLFPVKIPFPVAFDVLEAGNVLLTDEDLEILCQNYPAVVQSRERERKEIKAKIKNYFSSQPLLPYTFTVNQLQGTPSWILFDAEFNILSEWFGHQPEETVEQMIEQTINKTFAKTTHVVPNS